MHTTIRQEISVQYEYPVVFTRQIFSRHNDALMKVLGNAATTGTSPRVLVLVEACLIDLMPALASDIHYYMRTCLDQLSFAGLHGVEAGEPVKSIARSAMFVDFIAAAGLDRHSYVIAIGGGALLDAVGYAASLVHRGVRMIRVPTTVLSQCDGGVGVKNAINTPDGKNFLGTFAPPYAVINDLDFLKTLPDSEWRAGIAEAFKVAMIKDEAFLDWLCTNAEALGRRDESAMEHLVYRCAELHLQHIKSGGDPFEKGTSRPLDYGHWSAHQIERMTNYSIGHGAAVATGIALDALYAVAVGILSRDVAEKLIHGLESVGFALWHDALDSADELLSGLERFREHLGGQLSITLPCAAGRSLEINTVSETMMRACIQQLAARTRVASCT